MSLALHLFLHVLSAFIAGYIVWRFWRFPVIAFGAAFLGAVLIDLDHLIDYALAFGLHFDLSSFILGEQFVKNEKIYGLFHGWEYVILSLAVAWLIRARTRLKIATVALALGAFFHLLIDVSVNDGMTIKSYSIGYRALHNYEMQEVVTLEQYE